VSLPRHPAQGPGHPGGIVEKPCRVPANSPCCSCLHRRRTSGSCVPCQGVGEPCMPSLSCLPGGPRLAAPELAMPVRLRHVAIRPVAAWALAVRARMASRHGDVTHPVRTWAVRCAGPAELGGEQGGELELHPATLGRPAASQREATAARLEELDLRSRNASACCTIAFHPIGQISLLDRDLHCLRCASMGPYGLEPRRKWARTVAALRGDTSSAGTLPVSGQHLDALTRPQLAA